MALTSKNIKEALEILKGYNGVNSYVRYISNCMEKNLREISDFDYKYVLNNHNYKAVEVKKTVGITDWFGKKFAEANDLDFIPEKMYIQSIIGEMGEAYHAYVIYRKSMENAVLTYVPKKAVIGELFKSEKVITNIDFSKFNEITKEIGRTLKPHQEDDVQFLVGNKKCILASQQGLGKTTSCVVAAMAGGYRKILIICPASLKSTWKREICYYNDPETIEIVSGKEMIGDRKFTIINYDIVNNFYEVPKEVVTENVVEVDGNGKRYMKKVPVMVKSKTKKDTMVPKMKKTRDKEIIKKAMLSSKLYIAGFDLVIIDEAHKLSNNKSIRYETIFEFLKTTKPNGIFLVTGTPLTNSPLNLYHILRLIDADITKDYNYYMRRFCDMKEFRKRDGSTFKTFNGATNLDELREKIKHIYVRKLQKDIPGMVGKNIEKRYYSLTSDERKVYSKLWDEYLYAQMLEGNDRSEMKELIEGSIVRRYLAGLMTRNTIQLAEEHLEDDEKVFIVCCYDNEVEAFKNHFGDKCVVYNGKMTTKQKDKAEYEFMNNPKVKVFIGQVIAAGVGLTLTESHICIFNTFSWLSIENDQAMDRVYRLSQKEDVTIYFQLFDDEKTLSMWDKVMEKDRINKEIIIPEYEKKT